MGCKLQIVVLAITGLIGCDHSIAQSRTVPNPSPPPVAFEAAIARAHHLFQQQRLPEVESVLRTVLASDPRDAAALELMGEVRARQAKSQEAEDLFRMALASDPTLMVARLNLGLLLASSHHWEEGMSSLEVVLQVNPDDKTALNAEVDAALAMALDARNRGDRDGALIALLRARKYAPGNVRLLVSLGILEDEMRLYQDAAETLQQALLLEPLDPNALYAQARVQMDLQNLPQADADFRAYLKQKPSDATAHYGLGRTLLMAQKPAEARAEFQKSIELRPQQVESYYQLGDIDLEAGNLDRAEEFFQRALERDPRHGGALCGLGMVAFRKKQYDKAVEELALAVQSAPDYQKGRYYYGLALARVGRKLDAERELAIATRLADEENRKQAGKLQLKGPLQKIPAAPPRQ